MIAGSIEKLPVKGLEELLMKMMNPKTGVPVQDRKSLLRTHKNCFTGTVPSVTTDQLGTEVVDWLTANVTGCSREQAINLCQRLLAEHWIENVSDKQQEFVDGTSLYKFSGRLSTSQGTIPIQENEKISTVDNSQKLLDFEGELQRPVLDGALRVDFGDASKVGASTGQLQPDWMVYVW